MNYNLESPAPSIPHSTDSVPDTQITATFQSMVELRIREMIGAHAQELAIRDAQVADLQKRLASLGVDATCV